ncbi:MAG: hypothetical protein Q4A15_05260 [Prevotellaceae bacterium]|nr:hypothetical protein [Prevotellaceae bacterium]
MRRIAKLIMLLLLGTASSVNAQERIVVHPTDPSPTTDPTEIDAPQRSPIYIPSVFLSDYTLLFEECCFGCEIEIMENDEVVYSTIITDTNGTVQLPENLTGSFELHLYWGGLVFVGEIYFE